MDHLQLLVLIVSFVILLPGGITEYNMYESAAQVCRQEPFWFFFECRDVRIPATRNLYEV